MNKASVRPYRSPPQRPDTIQANTRKTYNMGEKIPNGKASIYVTCTTSGKQIMVERPAGFFWATRSRPARFPGTPPYKYQSQKRIM